jgi:hypothetical protein
MIKEGSKVILNDKYVDWEDFRGEEKTVLTVIAVDKIGDTEVAWFEEVSNNPDCLYGGCYALDGLEEVS